jgi:prevent-host-death family protein
MKLHNQVKPLSYVKAHAPEILADIAETGNPMVITVRGEAVAILQDVRSYEETLETIRKLSAASKKQSPKRKRTKR